MVVTQNGRSVAVRVGVQDDEEVEQLVMGYSPRLREILDLSRKQLNEGKGIRHDEFWADSVPPKGAKRPSKPKEKSAKARGRTTGKAGRVQAEPGVAADQPST